MTHHKSILYLLMTMVFFKSFMIYSCDDCRRQEKYGGNWSKREFSKLQDLMPKPVFEYHNWPSENELNKMKLLNANAPGVASNLYYYKFWQNLSLSKEWSPGANAEWLYVAENKYAAQDSYRVKWTKGNYELMLVRTLGAQFLKVTLLKGSFGKNRESRISTIKRMALSIIPKQPVVEKIRRYKIKDYAKNINMMFKPSLIKSSVIKGNSFLYNIHAYYGGESPWYEMINWFSYKNIFCMYFLTEEGGESVTQGYRASKWFDVQDAGHAEMIAFNELKKRKLVYNRSVNAIVKYKDNRWRVTFNKGKPNEVTIDLSRYGHVLDVKVDEKVAKASRGNPEAAEESYLNDLQLRKKKWREKVKLSREQRQNKKYTWPVKSIDSLDKEQRIKFNKSLESLKYFEKKRSRSLLIIRSVFAGTGRQWRPYYRGYERIPNYSKLKEVFPDREEPELLDAAFKIYVQRYFKKALVVLNNMKSTDKDNRAIDLKLYCLSVIDFSCQQALVYLDGLMKKYPDNKKLLESKKALFIKCSESRKNRKPYKSVAEFRKAMAEKGINVDKFFPKKKK